MAGTPYRSRMQPHWELIKKMREGGATWLAIAEKLEGLGVTTQPHGVQQYYKRKTQPKRGGLGLPGWGNPAPVYSGQTSDPATVQPQTPDAAGEGSAVPKPVPPPETEDFDFTPKKENDPAEALERMLRAKQSAATRTDSPEKQ